MVAQVVIQVAAAAESRDLALIERARTGDAHAFELLLEPQFPRLNRLALSIVANESDARDAIQEACLRAWRELPRLRDPQRFDVWLWRIAVNACRSVVRSRRRVSVHEIAILDAPAIEHRAAANLAHGDDLADSELIRRAFGRLDVDKRSVLILHHVEERPISDVARILGIPEGTAKWRLFSARRALERALEVESR